MHSIKYSVEASTKKQFKRPHGFRKRRTYIYTQDPNKIQEKAGPAKENHACKIKKLEIQQQQAIITTDTKCTK